MALCRKGDGGDLPGPAPSSPSTSEVLRSTSTVRRIVPSSSELTAAAIWRTPLLFTPSPEIVCASAATELYSPNMPNPEGPSSRAMALVRTMPMTIFSTCDPPTKADAAHSPVALYD